MLDQETKRKIDSARNIFLGKIPDPTEQVDQITTALIYKFMDDMDQESKDLGGKAKFFTGAYKKYSWPKIIDKRLSGQERLDLYTEALIQLPKHNTLPDLFKNIFKDAFLPYRNVETLNLFLKEINNFTYDHSENLGNAFEYLLSVLGAQGKAGQFRTPRHIIDFIVEVVSPKKEESILDPACGTAGFLISAYKHIIKNNSKNYKPAEEHYSFARSEASAVSVQIQSNGKYKGDKLRPAEKRALEKNIVGYDIAPKMVKLSLVNMYLHNFKKPKIYEYDTLTNSNRWEDDFNVILANPPFMQPKGGIRPHNKFSIQANRSEVLFVDYIAEHLPINGRAGIIVPEGVIFKSDKAFKALRKILVEEYLLWAVVSLPAKVFEPYSGVKTSILFLDKKRAKSNREILFVDVQNDGFDLGATRRKIDKNDLPEAFKVLKAWSQGKKEKSPIAHLVTKSKIANTGDYSLTGNKYKTVKIKPTKWPMVCLGKVCKLYQPKPISKKEMIKNGKYTVFGANGIIGKYNQYNHKESEILITCRGATCGTTNLSKPKSWITGNAMVVKPISKAINKRYLFYLLQYTEFDSVISGAAQPQITREKLSPFKIPLPPLKVQKEITAKIEQERAHIESCKKLINLHESKIRYKITQVWEQK